MNEQESRDAIYEAVMLYLLIMINNLTPSFIKSYIKVLLLDDDIKLLTGFR